MDLWYGPGWRSRSEYGTALHSAETRGALATSGLLALAGDAAQPGIVRATAITLAAPYVRPDALAQVQALLGDPDSLVRLAALGMLESFPARTRTTAAAPLLADPRRAVRIEAARLLANASNESFTPEQREARTKARQEYLDSLRTDADWPTTLVSRGNFELREGRMDDAIASYQRAIELDPRFAAGYVNLADALRFEGKDKDGDALLRRGLAIQPDAADLHHALGLLLIRQADRKGGVEELAQAVKLSPGNARYAYVYAVGLQSLGKIEEALAILVKADKNLPYDLDTLGALVSMNIELGRPDAVLPYARKLAEVLPDDPNVTDLISRLEKGR